MSARTCLTVVAALALPGAAVIAPATATARGGRAAAHHHRAHPRHARTLRFRARVVAATASGLVLRTKHGRTVTFSAAQITHRRARKHHRSHRVHGLNIATPGGGVVINILGLTPGVLVTVTETIAPDGSVSVTITLPPPSVQQTEQSATGTVTDVATDTFTLQTADGSQLRLHMAAADLAAANLNQCDTAQVSYHQDGGLLVADTAAATGSSATGDCAPGADTSDDVSGTITAIGSDSITVAGDQGPVTVGVDPASGLTDGYAVGDLVDVTYSQAQDGSLLASGIAYAEGDVSGQVTAVSTGAAASLTITADDGSTQTFSDGSGDGSGFDGIAVGDQVEIIYHTSGGQPVADLIGGDS